MKDKLPGTFEHDCGMGKAAWDRRIENDFGPDQVPLFNASVLAITEALDRASTSVDPKTNTDLLLHQLLPNIFPDPM